MAQNTNKDNNYQKVIWKYKTPNSHNILTKAQRSLSSIQKFNSENSPSTAQASSDIFNLAQDKKVQGLAAVAFCDDGSHYIVVSGSAIDENVRAAGAAFDLMHCLNKMSDHQEED
jgi:hypothetical protein